MTVILIVVIGTVALVLLPFVLALVGMCLELGIRLLPFLLLLWLFLRFCA